MEWIDRKNGYPKLKTGIIGNYAMMSISLEISESTSFGFGTGRDMNMTDTIDYILLNFKLGEDLKTELKKCRIRLNE